MDQTLQKNRQEDGAPHTNLHTLPKTLNSHFTIIHRVATRPESTETPNPKPLNFCSQRHHDLWDGHGVPELLVIDEVALVSGRLVCFLRGCGVALVSRLLAYFLRLGASSRLRFKQRVWELRHNYPRPSAPLAVPTFLSEPARPGVHSYTGVGVECSI